MKTGKKRTIYLKFMQKATEQESSRRRRCNTETGWLPLDQNHRLQEEKILILCNIRHIDITYEEFLDIFALGAVTKLAAIVSTLCRAIVLRTSNAVLVGGANVL
jgi:hypothetical protein